MKKVNKMYNEEKDCIGVSTGEWAKDYSHVDISEVDYTSEGKNKPKKWGVNWSAKGTVSVKEAKEYVVLINEAIKEAEKNNK